MSLNKPIKYLYFLLYISQTLFPKISTWKSKSTLHIGERFSYSLCSMPLPPVGTYTHKSDTTKNHYIYITI